MTFTTLTFAVFLVAVFSAYWLLKRRTAQNVLLVVASFVFYAWWDYRFTVLMLISALTDFLVGRGLRGAVRTSHRRLLLGASLLVNLGMLGFFKYFGFFVESFQALLEQLGYQQDPVTLRVVLPVGISFYTFQTMSYTLDIYRGAMRPSDRFIDYLAYVTFFPQLVAGPIERARQLLSQFSADRRFEYHSAVDGGRLILWGLVKKVLIADNMAVIVDAMYADPGAWTGPQLLLATVAFAFQIYCDFSGYSDIAIGTGRLFGINLTRNFAYPYFSLSLAEFWRRWHITLSTWFRDYVYIPLGGSSGSRPRRALNVMATFALSGLWHGASWNFIVWGSLNGAGVLPTMLRRGDPPRITPAHTPGGERLLPTLRSFLAMVATFGVICLGWVFFRAGSLSDAMLILGQIGRDALSLRAYTGVRYVLSPYDRWSLVILVVFVAVEWVQRRHLHPLVLPSWPAWARWSLYTGLLWLTLLRQGPGFDFIYFQF